MFARETWIVVLELGMYCSRFLFQAKADVLIGLLGVERVLEAVQAMFSHSQMAPCIMTPGVFNWGAGV